MNDYNGFISRFQLPIISNTERESTIARVSSRPARSWAESPSSALPAGAFRTRLQTGPFGVLRRFSFSPADLFISSH